MEATEGGATGLDVPVVELGDSEAGDALALSREAGWDQTVEDWSLMIRAGEAFAIQGPDGRPVASALALPYPPEFGWISMVLVHGPWRRRGLGTRLLERALAALRERGLVAFLDATPAGRALYEPMGFRAIEPLARWRGPGGGAGNGARFGPVPDVSGIAELDRAAFGADRSAVLADLLGRPGAVSGLDPEKRGFFLSRPGRTAAHVGPIVATDSGVACDLLEAALDSSSGPVLVDVPDREVELVRLLRDRGFEAERPYTRMALDHGAAFGEPGLVRAIAGPELG